MSGNVNLNAVERLELYNRIVLRSACGETYRIDCPKGLWGVVSWAERDAELEARHYFQLYYEDGEYEEYEKGII